MTRRMTAWSTLLVCLVGAPAAPVLGVPVTFMFSGEITLVEDENDLLGAAISVGTTFSGWYAFESTTPDMSPASPAVGFYVDAVTEVTGELGGIPFNGPLSLNNMIDVFNSPPGLGSDRYRVDASVMFLPDIPESIVASLWFFDRTGTVFADDSMPLVPPDIERFDSAFFGLGNENIPLRVTGTVTSLVPEPGTVLLLAFGATAFATRRRCRAPWDERSAKGGIHTRSARPLPSQRRLDALAARPGTRRGSGWQHDRQPRLHAGHVDMAAA